MAKFGWCMSNRHADHEDNPCPAKFQKFVHIPPKRNKPSTIEFLDEWIECDCSCHTGETKKTIRKRKK